MMSNNQLLERGRELSLELAVLFDELLAMEGPAPKLRRRRVLRAASTASALSESLGSAGGAVDRAGRGRFQAALASPVPTPSIRKGGPSHFPPPEEIGPRVRLPEGFRYRWPVEGGGWDHWEDAWKVRVRHAGVEFNVVLADMRPYRRVKRLAANPRRLGVFTPKGSDWVTASQFVESSFDPKLFCAVVPDPTRHRGQIRPDTAELVSDVSHLTPVSLRPVGDVFPSDNGETIRFVCRERDWRLMVTHGLWCSWVRKPWPTRRSQSK